MVANPVRFKRLELSEWRQYRQVDVQFHPRLTVITGANGSGKTTLLNILSQHFGWSVPHLSTPLRARDGVFRWSVGKWLGRVLSRTPEAQTNIGRLEYDNGEVTELTLPGEGTERYSVNFSRAQAVPGIFISSHRPVLFYQRVDNIPSSLNARQQLLDTYLNEIRTHYSGGHTGRSAGSRLKESLISLATFGYGNQVVESNPEAVATFEGFESILRKVLPPEIGFRRFAIRMPEVVFETASGDFAFEAMSGGTAAIVDLAWQIHLRSLIDRECVALIDEPENHLHPALQQAVLPGFIEAFPDVQFIVTTHNPFVVTSVADSNVYVLKFVDSEAVEDRGHERAVSSFFLDTANKSGTANEILRDVLGLPFTVPLWVARELDRIVQRFSGRELTDEMLQELRAEMADLRLDDLYPETLGRLLEGRE